MEEELIYRLARDARDRRRPGQLIRWESDHQGGGRFVLFIPNVTPCWSCGVPIDESGDCEEGCYGSG